MEDVKEEGEGKQIPMSQRHNSDVAQHLRGCFWLVSKIHCTVPPPTRCFCKRALLTSMEWLSSWYKKFGGKASAKDT